MNNHEILIVDDDMDVIDTLTQSLTYQGFATKGAELGQKVYDFIETEPISLILLDVNLPDIQGCELCRSLRRSGYNLPIVMMSFEDQEAAIVRGLESGANDYITKPFSVEELISRVRAHLHWQQVYSGEKPVSLPQDEVAQTRDTGRDPRLRRKRESTPHEMPLLTRLALKNQDQARKNSATAKIEAVDRTRVDRWNRELSEQLDKWEAEKFQKSAE